MIETEMQQLLIDAAKSIGGQGLKLNNRFIKGVVDVMLQVPGRKTGIVEVKRRDYVKPTGEHFDLEATKLQRNFLLDWGLAGAVTGLVSFTQKTGKGVKSLAVAAYTTHDMMNSHWTARYSDHVPLGGPDERYENILQELDRGLRWHY